MKIYLAGSNVERERFRGQAQRIRNLGHEVVSSWHDRTDDAEPCLRLSENALSEINDADVLFLDTRFPDHDGTMWVEYGYALHVMRCWVVGGCVNSWVWMTDDRFESWYAAEAWLKREAGA